MILKMWKTLKR